MSKFVHSRLLLAAFAFAVACGFSPLATGQGISRVETKFDGFGGVTGISGAFDVQVSPDGEHVYVIGSFPTGGGSIAVFSRNAATGAVTFVEAHLDDLIMGGAIDGLRSARSVAISPDGKHVYVASLLDYAVVVFVRNTSPGVDFGKLTYFETHKDGLLGVDGLEGAHGVTISGDGEHVYVASRGQDELPGDEVAVFSRDSGTGALTFVEVHKNGVGPVTGLEEAERLVLSPDDKHLYVASEAENAPGSVAVFSRNTDTMSGDFGKLTFVESETDGVNGADGLAEANEVAVSPDGNHVYVSNRAGGDSEDWIGIFSRNATTGALTFVNKLNADAAGLLNHPDELCPSAFLGAAIASEIVVSADGKLVFASNNRRGSVVLLTRNEVSGLLTPVDKECDKGLIIDPNPPNEIVEVANEGIVTINAVALSPDGRNLYTTGLGPPASLVVLTGIDVTVEFQEAGVEVPPAIPLLDNPPDSGKGTDFGVLNPSGGMLKRVFEIWNDGFLDLTLTGPSPVSVEGANASHYGVEQPVSLILAPGEKTEFSVTYDPTATGVHEATVRIASDEIHEESPYDFPVTGTGVNGDPDITVEFQSTAAGIPDGDTSPSALKGTDFGTFVEAGVSMTHTFEIRNDGVVNMNLTGSDPASLSGAGASQFEITQPDDKLLVPGQSTTFSVTYTATVDGVHAANVSLDSDDPDEDPFDFGIVATNRTAEIAAAKLAAELAAAQRAAEQAALINSIKKLKKKIKDAQRRKQTSKARRLKKKLRKLNARLRAL